MFETYRSTRSDYATLCPHCEHSHHYVEIRFPAVNDHGYWEIECAKCKKIFIVEVENPQESGGGVEGQIKGRYVGRFDQDRGIVASKTLRHNIDLNRNAWSFNYETAPLYECAKTSANLEVLAKSSLEENFKDIVAAYRTAQNYLMSSGPDCDFSVVHLPLTCGCKSAHTATFYMPLLMDHNKGPTSSNDFLLADISGAKLDETLDGIVTKNDAMDLLEKLIVRWNLLAQQILIVSPFVGTSYMKREKQLVVWDWLLKMLDPAKSVFLTRTKTVNDYKKAMESKGFPMVDLKKFGLENRIIAMDARKTDFHAKFFAAFLGNKCEVMSGSANLVRGPSVENISFKRIDKDKFVERYTDRLKLKKPLPTPKERSKHWVFIEKGPSGWRSCEKSSDSYLPVQTMTA